MRIRDVALKTCQKQLMIGRSGERGSGISELAARHDDDDHDDEVLNPSQLAFPRFQLSVLLHNSSVLFSNRIGKWSLP